MTQETREVIRFILKLLNNKKEFVFWFAVRFVSALFPLFSIYLFSRTIRIIESNSSLDQIYPLIAIIFLIFTIDNTTRILSVFKLDYLISNFQFYVHDFLITDLKTRDKAIRHEAIQAIRNFSEAVRVTFELFRQPGIDSLVSLMITPVILFFLDFKVFALEVAYILIYYFIDTFTTERYARLKNAHNLRVEDYYAKLQDSNDILKEERQFTKHYQHLCNWGIVEWFSLQTVAVTFYSFILLYLAINVIRGDKSISDLVLIIGYVASTQIFLNNLSTVKDRLTDTKVALSRLARSRSVISVDISDLIRS
ncbi:MAG: hypothetical protein WC686_03515 [Candidatus Shapirobacteria bacterium]